MRDSALFQWIAPYPGLLATLLCVAVGLFWYVASRYFPEFHKPQDQNMEELLVDIRKIIEGKKDASSAGDEEKDKILADIRKIIDEPMDDRYSGPNASSADMEKALAQLKKVINKREN